MADVDVSENDMVVVDHTTTNYGGKSDTQDITLDADGVTKDTNSGVTLDPGETYRGQLVWGTEAGDAQAADYNVCVVTEDGNEDCITVNVS